MSGDGSKPVIFGKPFVSGDPRQNPGGRPKELAELKRLIRNEGPAIVEHLIEIAKGDAGRDVITMTGALTETPKFSDRTAAAALLFAYGYGRPTQTVEMVNGGDEPQRQTLDLSKLTDQELLVMQQLALKARRTEGEQ